MTDARLDAAQPMVIVGTMMMLARTSPLHSRYQVAQLLDRTWPSIMRRHFRIYREKETGKPIGFCNWILLSQSNLDEILEEKRPLRPEDWDSGDIPFFPEMIAPFGHLRSVIIDLRDDAMKGVPWGYSLRGMAENADGTVPEQKVFKWKGRKAKDGTDEDAVENTGSPIRMI